MIHIVIKVRDMENLDKDHMLIDNSHHRMAMYIDKYNNSKLAVYMYHHLNTVYSSKHLNQFHNSYPYIHSGNYKHKLMYQSIYMFRDFDMAEMYKVHTDIDIEDQ